MSAEARRCQTSPGPLPLARAYYTPIFAQMHCTLQALQYFDHAVAGAVMELTGLASGRLLPLLGYVSGQLETCFGNISEAIQAELDGRPLPGASATSISQARAPKPATPKARKAKAKANPSRPKRKPTAFNIFVKRKMEALRAGGFTAPDDVSGNGAVTS